ncbi:MAG: FadR/GntR family transcriptional regulator [Thermodesulfobacteriota bacterium]|nr:FadR/GntR family transcriptional regulator [Thermodesulfobacteriota bacterium]
MEPMKKVRLSEQVIDAIKQMISKEGFGPGDKFYSENKLTRKLDVSRSSIREAIRILEVTGFVSVKQGKGIFISDSIGDGFGALSDWVKNNETFLIEHFEVRLIIDPKAATYAARNAGDDDIKKMEEACEEFVKDYKAGNTAGMIKADKRFHKTIAKSTKNRTLFLIMKTMTESLPEGWISSLHIPGRANKTITEHESVIQAIKTGDSGAAERAMAQHIENALHDIRVSIVGTL